MNAYAIRAPSGDHDTDAYEPSVTVSRSGSPPSAETTNTSLVVVRSQSSWRAEVNAMRVPSGDHDGGPSSMSPLVIRTAGASPSRPTT